MHTDAVSWSIGVDDLEALELGARWLGSGGAGDPYLGRLLLESSWAPGFDLEVYELTDCPSTAMIISVGLAGSVTAFAEKPAAGNEFATAFDRLSRHVAHTGPTLVAGYETAGINAFLPLLAAVQAGVPLVDVDGMGRGMSWVDQTTYDAAGHSPCPAVLTEPSGEFILLEGMTGRRAEAYVRSLTVQMGGWSAFAGYALSLEKIRDSAVQGSLRRSLHLGHSVLAARAARRSYGHLGPHLEARVSGCQHLGQGRITSIRWTYPEGYPRASFTVGVTGESPRPIRVEAANEFLLVIDEGRIRAQSPDVIAMLDPISGRAYLAEQLTEGTEVDLLTIPAPERWQQPDVASRSSLAYYGIEVPTDY